MSDPYFSSEIYDPDRLIGGHKPLITREVTLTDIGSTGALVRGSVLGMITASGKYGISLAASVDGSEVVRAFLVKATDPGDGDVIASVYDEGEFNEDRLTCGAGHDADSVREDLRAVGIHLKEAVPI